MNDTEHLDILGISCLEKPIASNCLLCFLQDYILWNHNEELRRAKHQVESVTLIYKQNFFYFLQYLQGQSSIYARSVALEKS